MRMEDEEEETVEEPSFAEDPRVQFLGSRLARSLRLPEDQWRAYVEEEAKQQLLADFFAHSWPALLAFCLPRAGGLAASSKIPSGMKCKVLCIMKTTDHIEAENYKTDLRFEELLGTPIAHVLGFLEEDMDRHVEIMKNKIFVMNGILSGRTLLPIPTVAAETDLIEMHDENKQDSYTRSVLHAVESMIIKWSHQIRDIVEWNSAQPLLYGFHPDPMVELKFWKKRKDNLYYIYKQLQSPVVQKMVRILKAKNSSYYPTFQDIYKEVKNALVEARDVELHLRPLEGYIQCLQEAEFPKTHTLIPSLFHIVCLIWSHSKFYRIPARIIVLLQEFCNLFIDQAMSYLSPEDLMKRETEETLEHLQDALNTLRSFRDSFFSYRKRVAAYFSNSQEFKPWDFQPQMVFARFDMFLTRLEKIEDIFVIMLEFERLEKLEFGGSKGKILNDQICRLNEEFMESCKIFTASTYNPLDYNNVEFDENYEHFKYKILEFERHLGSIFCVGFIDCSGLESAFKLLAIFGYFLEKPVIADIFSPNYKILLQMFDEELCNCKHLYDEHIKQVEEGNAIVHKNMPFTSGNLKWSQEIKGRIQSFWSNFSVLSHPVLESSEGALIYQKYTEMLILLDQYEEEIYCKWKSKVDDVCQFNLDQSLIKRSDKDGLLSVNFDPKLVAVLRDVKYLLLLGHPDIPRSALEMYKKRRTFDKHIGVLELVVQWYNKIKQTVLEVEYPMIETELRTIDDLLMEAEETFTWQEENCWEYTEHVKATVYDLEERLQKSKDNLKAIQQIMKGWMEQLIFYRKDNKKEALLNLEDKEDRLSKKFLSLREDSCKIHTLVQENLMLLKAHPDSDSWKIYLEFIDDIIVDGFFNVIMHNLNFFLENTETSLKTRPLFQVQMTLSASDIAFKPSLDKEAGDGFYDLIDELLSNIFKMSGQVKRVATHIGMQHYQNDMDSMLELSETRKVIMGRVEDVITKAVDFKTAFEPYAYLWIEDRSEFMKQFLFDGHMLTSGETETRAKVGTPDQLPTTEQFKEQIDIYENLYIQVSKLDDFRIFDGWFKVDIKPFLICLLNIIKKWSWMFKEYLLRFVIDSLTDLEEFIKMTDAGLQKELKEGDYNRLVDVMVHLLAVRDRQATTNELFKPLKDTIILLESYGQKMPDHIYVLVEELPERWNTTKKLAVSIKHEVAPLLTSEVTLLRKKCAAFDGKQIGFRERFRVDAPFHFDAKTPYVLLDKENRELEALEEEMLHLKESANLFEVIMPDYKQMKQCRKEIQLLKRVWDINIYVTSAINDWTKSHWREISMEQMDVEIRRFAKEMLSLDKEVRLWNVYVGLEFSIKNMLTSLKVITELQNPAMRDRHWYQLMDAIGISENCRRDATIKTFVKILDATMKFQGTVVI